MSLARSVATIGGFTLLSRVLGLVRDKLIAHYLGAGWQTDAFFVAFKLPNFFRRLFAEGAFSSAFVPLFTGKLAQDGEPSARQFASEAFSVLLVALIFLTALIEIIMPWFMLMMAPGFTDDPPKYALAVELSRITFPYLLLISMVAMWSGILNSVQKFGAAASAPILMNLTLIAALIWLRPHTETPAHALAIGVTLAGITQLGWVIWFCRRTGLAPRFVRPHLTPAVKRLLTLAAPVALGASVAQINLLVDVIIASNIPDAVSYLYFADRLNELPLGVIGIAIGTALLPTLSRQIKSDEPEKAIASLNRAVELGMLFSLPAAGALAVIALPIVRVLFEGGAFGELQSIATASAVIAYAAGLPAFVAIKAFAPGFFAHEDTRTPVKIGILCLLVNFVLNLILMGPLQHVGLALATTIAGWLNVGLMAYTLHKRGIFAPDMALTQRLPRIALSAALMSLALWGAHLVTGHWLDAPFFQRASVLLGYVLCGALIYFISAFTLKATEWSEVKRYLKRSGK